ncbi:hypothetical protein OAL67_00610 [bacterium]|nr:hypothetical protein [bacterium]
MSGKKHKVLFIVEGVNGYFLHDLNGDYVTLSGKKSETSNGCWVPRHNFPEIQQIADELAEKVVFCSGLEEFNQKRQNILNERRNNMSEKKQHKVLLVVKGGELYSLRTPEGVPLNNSGNPVTNWMTVHTGGLEEMEQRAWELADDVVVCGSPTEYRRKMRNL